MPSQLDPVSDHLPEAVTAPQDTPSEAAPTPVPAGSMKDLVSKAHEALEVQIASREATVRVQGKPLVLKRWGLQKKLSLGSRVLSLVESITKTFPDLFSGDEPSSSRLLAVMSHVSGFVVELVASSLVQPFKTLAEAEEWLDENADMTDLFNLSIVVYEQNFGADGEGLKKYISDLKNLGANLTAKVMSPSLK